MEKLLRRTFHPSYRVVTPDTVVADGNRQVLLVHLRKKFHRFIGVVSVRTDVDMCAWTPRSSRRIVVEEVVNHEWLASCQGNHPQPSGEFLRQHAIERGNVHGFLRFLLPYAAHLA